VLPQWRPLSDALKNINVDTEMLTIEITEVIEMALNVLYY